MTSATEPVCDPDTGVCSLPPKSEPIVPLFPSINLATLPILRDADVTTLNTDKGDPIPIDSLNPTPLTLLYFSASWCPPCRSFTPKLVNFLKSQKDIHCILVSCDRNSDDYLEYLTEHCHGMYALPYAPETMRQKIMSSLGVHGIPSLIVMDSAGKVVTHSGRGAVEGNPEGCVNEWLQGKEGTNWKGSINWMSILLYVGLFVVWWWWSHSPKASS